MNNKPGSSGNGKNPLGPKSSVPSVVLPLTTTGRQRTVLRSNKDNNDGGKRKVEFAESHGKSFDPLTRELPKRSLEKDVRSSNMGNIRRRPSAAPPAKETNTTINSKVLILNLEQAQQITKMPKKFIEDFSEWFGQRGLCSARIDLVLVGDEDLATKRPTVEPLSHFVANAHPDAATGAPKDINAKSKTSPRLDITAATIPLSAQLGGNKEYSSCTNKEGKRIEVGYNLLDNKALGDYPKGVKLEDVKDNHLFAVMQKTAADVQEVKKIHSVSGQGYLLACKYAVKIYEKVPKSEYVQGGDHVREISKSKNESAKCFIQSSASLHSILKDIVRGIRTGAEYNDKINELSFLDNKGNKIYININELILQDAASLVEIKEQMPEIMRLIDTTKKNNMSLEDFDEGLYELFSDEKILDDAYGGLWYFDNGCKEKLPIMVMAGENGWPIYPDLDLLLTAEHADILSNGKEQIQHPQGISVGTKSILKSANEKKQNITKEDLKKLLYENINYLDTENNNILDRIETCVNSLFSYSLQVLDNEEKKHIDYLLAMAKNAREYCKQREKEGTLQWLGVTSIYSLLEYCDFNSKHPDSLWMHGRECNNPAIEPEKSTSMLSFWKNQFYVSTDEKSYLVFLLHDKDILKDKAIPLHPYWVREDGPYSELWQDIIKIQAYNHIEKYGSAESYFQYLKANFTTPKRVDDKKIVEAALQLVKNLQDEVNENVKQEIMKYVGKDKDYRQTKYFQNKIIPRGTCANKLQELYNKYDNERAIVTNSSQYKPRI